MKKSRDKGKTVGWILIIAGIVIGWSPFKLFRVYWKRSRKPFGDRFSLCWRILGLKPYRQYLLVCALALVIIGLVLLFVFRKREEPWKTSRKSRVKRLRKMIGKITDIGLLRQIISQAPLEGVRSAASERRKVLWAVMLDQGDLEAIRQQVSSVVQFGMYDNDCTDFLAEAGKRYPQIVREFWPNLQKWAHSDQKSHDDHKAGFHTDRTEYYDYFRYPNGRTVANTNGRKKHTDTRGSYSDCHDDHHKDVTNHTDFSNDHKISRFKSWTDS
ncbi:MAG: hypothetical protein J6Y20_04325 [Lachnospiraceae bacterium]|nr:hypothetical protein [Lachnospiraceae bacterium]